MSSASEKKEERPDKKLWRNVLLGLLAVLVICLMLFYIIGENVGGHDAWETGFAFAVLLFPLLTILLGNHLYFGRNLREGKILMRAGLVAIGILVLWFFRACGFLS